MCAARHVGLGEDVVVEEDQHAGARSLRTRVSRTGGAELADLERPVGAADVAGSTTRGPFGTTMIS